MTQPGIDDLYAPPGHSEELKSDASQIRRIVFWWEKRQLIYNLTLLPFGLICLWIMGFDEFGFTLFGAFCFGVAANLCFLTGPLATFVVKAHFPVMDSLRFASLLFWSGIAFTILVMSLITGSIFSLKSGF